MHRATRATLIALIAGGFLAFLFFLGYSFVVHPRDILLESMRRPWILRNALLLLIENAVPVVVAALTITYSAIINPESSASESVVVTNVFDNVRGPLAVLTILTMAYALSLGLLVDRVEGARGRLVALSTAAANYREAGEQALDAGEDERGLRLLRLYLSIVGRDPAISQRIVDTAVGSGPGETPETGEEAASGLSDTEAMERARAAMAKEDYVNAHYYARMALEMSPNWAEARTLLSDARENLGTPGRLQTEGAEKTLFETKRRGYEALSNNNPVDAYFIFRELARTHPEDPDVEHFYAESVAQLRTVALLESEMRTWRASPGYENIVFRTLSGGERAIVRIGTLVPGTGFSYAYDIEYLRFEPNTGDVSEHMRATAGKLLGTTLYLRLVDDGSPADHATTTGDWLVGEPTDDEPLLELGYGVDQLALFRASPSGAPLRTVPQQLRMQEIGPPAGYEWQPIATRLALEFTKPFALVVLSVSGIAFAWSHRSRSFRRPVVLLLPAILLIPLVAHVIYQFYLEAHRSMVLLLLRSLEFSTSLVVLAVVELALLFGAIFYLAKELNQNTG